MSTTKTDNLEADWDLLQHEIGYIAHDFYENGVRVLVMRGPATWCAYLGIPKSHPLAGFDYDDIPLSCHGGLTYSREGGGDWPMDYWWYGWDYGHSGDRFGFADPKSRAITNQFDHSAEKAWTAEEVKQEAIQTAWEFAKLKKLAENINQQVSSKAKAKEE